MYKSFSLCTIENMSNNKCCVLCVCNITQYREEKTKLIIHVPRDSIFVLYTVVVVRFHDKLHILAFF